MKILGRDFSDRNSPAYSTAWVEQVLTELETHLPRMRRECSGREFRQWLSGEADSVQRGLPTEKRRHEVRLRIEGLVKEQVRARNRNRNRQSA
ncbi:hypothetical protein J2W94_001263 [Pseudoxanthomonas sacheonensis]|uniref:Uncharacterized protein n=1 Tax=Pseudoxanthomonas sacheonensis TaxID=443615 RepID=A0ABU1RQD9_9GAMM|nr:hypothetical protein [Pseudoxanthomonas sacheonensis]